MRRARPINRPDNFFNTLQQLQILSKVNFKDIFSSYISCKLVFQVIQNRPLKIVRKSFRYTNLPGDRAKPASHSFKHLYTVFEQHVLHEITPRALFRLVSAFCNYTFPQDFCSGLLILPLRSYNIQNFY